MAERLETGAANAWEERNWVRSDLATLSGRRRADLRNPDQSRKVVDDLEGFYEVAAKLIEHTRALEVVPENDRLLRALGSMGRIMQADGEPRAESRRQASMQARASAFGRLRISCTVICVRKRRN
jgi:type IV secretion system T-DNA border endonuclease VirD2